MHLPVYEYDKVSSVWAQIRSSLTVLAYGKRLENLWYVKQRICTLLHFKRVFGRHFGGVENGRQIFNNFHDFYEKITFALNILWHTYVF